MGREEGGDRVSQTIIKMERVPEISCYSKVQHKHLKEKLPEPIRNHQSAKRPTAAFNRVKKKKTGRGGREKERKERSGNSYKQVSERESGRKKGQEREGRKWVH